MAKPLELRQRPGATRREGRRTPLCQAPGRRDQVGQICLPMFDPSLVGCDRAIPTMEEFEPERMQ
jgi:hypothetical protein